MVYALRQPMHFLAHVAHHVVDGDAGLFHLAHEHAGEHAVAHRIGVAQAIQRLLAFARGIDHHLPGRTGHTGEAPPADGAPLFREGIVPARVDDGEGERAVDQALPVRGAGAVLAVEVELVGVVGEQGEPDVVRLGHRAAVARAVDVADGEVLEVTRHIGS